MLLPTAKTAVPFDLPLLPTSVPLILIDVNVLRSPVSEPAPNATSSVFFALALAPTATAKFELATASEPTATDLVPVAFVAIP